MKLIRSSLKIFYSKDFKILRLQEMHKFEIVSENSHSDLKYFKVKIITE